MENDYINYVPFWFAFSFFIYDITEADMMTKTYLIKMQVELFEVVLYFANQMTLNIEMSYYVICSSGDLSVSELSSVKELPDQSLNKCNKCWNTSSKFLRPRIFCLEHAVQISEMLQSKGGANVLIICHSGQFADCKYVCIFIL